jgi:hypothetical protein
VTCKTLIGIVTRTQSVGIGGELREQRVEFFQAVDWIFHCGRAVGHHRAIVTGRFKLSGAQNAFDERSFLVVGDFGAGRRMIADEWWRRNLDALGLKPAARVLQSAAHTWVSLRETIFGKQANDAGNKHRGKNA